MASINGFSETTAADKSAIGFDYQYYFFLWKVLCLQYGQSVGLECIDDVHTDLDNDVQVLYQLKHTVKISKSTDKPSNLTTLDPDLWKTLSNWALLIQDPDSGRITPVQQLDFVAKTLFVLASNKSKSNRNDMSSLIEKTINGDVVAKNLKCEINAISDESSSKNILKYSANICSLSDDVLFKFIKNISFELGEDHIIGKCHEAVKAKMLDEKDIETAFKLVDSEVRSSNFINIKLGEKIVISFDDFHKKYRKFFQRFLNGELVIYSFDEQLPAKVQDFTFMQQLLEIKDINIDELERMTVYTGKMLNAKKNINIWLSDGDITSIDLKFEEENAILFWENKWRPKYRKMFDESIHNDLAIELVDCLRGTAFTFKNLPDDLSFSNGYLYYLSDSPKIGWRKDWVKYK
jgi:hypothetical protein